MKSASYEADESHPLAASKRRQRTGDLRKPFQASRDIFGKDRAGLLRGLGDRTGDDLCIEPLDPIGPSELPGFSTGYLIGCAVVASIFAVELIVVILLQ